MKCIRSILRITTGISLVGLLSCGKPDVSPTVISIDETTIVVPTLVSIQPTTNDQAELIVKGDPEFSSEN